IGVSQSRIAADLRQTVRQQLLAGKSNEQIRQYMISRYGLFAVYDPPMSSATWLLWFGPLILLLIAGTVGFVALRKRKRLLAGRDRDADLNGEAGRPEEGRRS